jgi:hypothetical protein
MIALAVPGRAKRRGKHDGRPISGSVRPNWQLCPPNNCRLIALQRIVEMGQKLTSHFREATDPSLAGGKNTLDFGGHGVAQQMVLVGIEMNSIDVA